MLDTLVGFDVNVMNGELSRKMELEGMCQLIMSPERKLILKAADGSGKQGVWPVWLLRRYGVEKDVFYFESGRRCASGPGVLTFKSKQAVDIMKLVDQHQKAKKEEITRQRNEQSRAIAAAKKATRMQQETEEAEKQKAQDALMEKHRRQAEIQAKKEMEERRRAEAKSAKERAEAEQRALAEKEQVYEDRAELLKRRDEALAMRKAAAAKLEMSKKEEEKLASATKTEAKASMFGAPKPVWGEGKSKIWCALNPEPLAQKTLAERRAEDEDEVVNIGLLGAGSRDYMSSNGIDEMDEDNLDEMDEINSDEELQGLDDNREVLNDSADEGEDQSDEESESEDEDGQKSHLYN